MRSVLRRSTMAVAVFATAGVGMLGASVQGIAAVDGDLEAAVREHRQELRQDVRDDGRRDCPREHRKRPTDLRS